MMLTTIDKATMSTNLCTLKVSDMMTTPVQMVQENWSIKMVLDYLLKHHITGVPVTNAQGDIKGVVSMSDILRFENLSSGEKKQLIAVSCYSEYLGHAFEEDDLQRLMQYADFNCAISQIMTPHIISVSTEAFVPEVALLMREQKIHRVFVVDQQKLVGVVSTSNILDALLSACAWP
jgi:CBS domain-containing protein